MKRDRAMNKEKEEGTRGYVRGEKDSRDSGMVRSWEDTLCRSAICGRRISEKPAKHRVRAIP